MGREFCPAGFGAWGGQDSGSRVGRIWGLGLRIARECWVAEIACLGVVPAFGRYRKTTCSQSVREEVSAVEAGSTIEHISAVTFAVRNMGAAIGFYEKLGFSRFYGGPGSGFSSLRGGDAVVNLAASHGYEGTWWGRVIFRVNDVDAHYRALVAVGLNPERPRDAMWGERFFHIKDLDGHELSFAELLER